MSRINVIKAIPTTYKGITFRSRVEARWARFFDEIEIKWEYEREGFVLPCGPYLPDFWLPELEMWAEVKGQDFSEIETQRCAELAEATDQKVLMLSGPPALQTYEYFYLDPISREVFLADYEFSADAAAVGAALNERFEADRNQ